MPHEFMDIRVTVKHREEEAELNSEAVLGLLAISLGNKIPLSVALEQALINSNFVEELIRGEDTDVLVARNGVMHFLELVPR